MKTGMVDLAVIVVYLILMSAVGVVFKRFNRSSDDFMRSGCRATWWLCGASCFMSIFSAWTFTGGAAVAYEAGWSFSVLFLMNALGFAVQGFFFAPWFRQLRAVSIPEVIRRRFDERTQQFMAWLGIVTGTLSAAISLYGLAVFTAAVTGYPISGIILVLGAVVVFYSFSSGSWAVMATDFLQTVILFPVTILVAYLAFQELGGFGGFREEIASAGLTGHFRLIKADEFAAAFNDFSWCWAVGILLGKSVEFIGLNGARRFFGVKDGKEASKAAFLAAGLMVVGAVLWAVPPMASRLFYADKVMAVSLANPVEASYAVACAELLPQGILGLVLVAMFSATMSSMDTGLNTNASIIVNDIYPAFCGWFKRPVGRDAVLLRLVKLCTLVLGTVIVFLALNFSRLRGVGMFRLMMELSAIFGSVIGVPMVIGLFVRRVPKWSAMASILIGAVPSAAGFFSGKPVFTESGFFSLFPFLCTPWNYQTRVIVNMAVTGTAFLLCGLFYKAEARYAKKVDEFFAVMKKPVDFEKEVGGSVDVSQLEIIGGFSMLIGVLVALLLFLPELTRRDIGGLIFISASIVATGAGLYAAGHRSKVSLRRSVPGAKPILPAAGNVVSGTRNDEEA